MFGTWFKNGDDKKGSENESTGNVPVSPHNASQLDTDSGPSLERAVTTISTPHDAILAELLSQRPEVDSPAKFNDESSVKDEEVNSPGHYRARSPTREPLHDPFSGSIVGLTIPEEREQDGVDFESTEDELWTHMAHIREVQSQIANMHVTMEGIGLGTQGEQGTAGRSVPLIHPSEGDKWEDEEADEEAAEKKAREQEFARLAEKFSGRKEATAHMMNKLDELSHVVRTFHALRTPMVNFAGSRSKTTEVASPTETIPPAFVGSVGDKHALSSTAESER